MNDKADKIQHTPTWEKIVGLLGLTLLCIGFAYLGWAAITEQDKPPNIVFTVTEINDLETDFLVQVEVANTGFKSVAGLDIEGRLIPRNGSPETSTAEVDYVPSGSSRSVGLFFNSDPRVGTLSLRALGYQEP